MRWRPRFALPALVIALSVVGVGYATWYFEDSQYQEIVIDETEIRLSAKATVGTIDLVVEEGYGEDPGKAAGDNPELILILEQTWVGFDDQVTARFTPSYDIADGQYVYPAFQNYVFRMTVQIQGGLESYLEAMMDAGTEGTALEDGQYVFDWRWSEAERDRILQAEGGSDATYSFTPELTFRYKAGMVPEDEADFQNLLSASRGSSIELSFTVDYQEA